LASFVSLDMVSLPIRKWGLHCWSTCSAVPVCIFVWFPDQTTAIAHFVGVGRGADLLFYCWLLASSIIMFNLHIKANEQLQMLTDLARAWALASSPSDIPCTDADLD